MSGTALETTSHHECTDSEVARYADLGVDYVISDSLVVPCSAISNFMLVRHRPSMATFSIVTNTVLAFNEVLTVPHAVKSCHQALSPSRGSPTNLLNCKYLWQLVCMQIPHRLCKSQNSYAKPQANP